MNTDYILTNKQAFSPANKQEVHRSHYKGRKWNILSLGIPYLAHKVKVFLERFIHREKAGIGINVAFNLNSLTQEENERLNKYCQFYEILKTPLKCIQREMAIKMHHEAAQKKEQSEKVKDTAQVQYYDTRINVLKNLLALDVKKKATRHDFNEADWNMIDEIDYAILQEHFARLNSFFNAEWYQSMPHHNKLKRGFNIDYRESIIAEILAFTVAYVQNLDGKTLNLPIYDHEKEIFRLVPYTLTAATLGDNLPYYILESDDPMAQTWVAVRGTQRFRKLARKDVEVRMGSTESIISDILDPKCLARHIINKALVARPIVNKDAEKQNAKYQQKESLEDIFMKLKASNKRIVLVGHSLGGTIVNTLGAEFAEIGIEQFVVYGFSAPGVSKQIADKWNGLLKKNATADKNAASIPLPKIINFDHHGDLVPALGKFLIGDHFAVEALSTAYEKGLYKSHVQRHLWNNCDIHQVDIVKENNKLERKIADFFRIIIGKLVQAIMVISKSKFPDWWIRKNFYKAQAKLVRKIRPQIASLQN